VSSSVYEDDCCHFNRAGNHALAVTMARDLGQGQP